jgi:CAAX prenyl protease-like protein
MTWWRDLREHPAFPYVLPFFLFGVFLFLEGLHPLAIYVVYPAKTIVVGASLFLLRRRLPDFNLQRPIAAVWAGVLVFILWVGLDPLLVRHQLPLRGFNPFRIFPGPGTWSLSGSLIFFRILGATLVVPIMEELFWRGFLMRYFINENFKSVPLGTYRPFSFFVTTAFFASVHGPQWPLGIVAGLIYGLWFVRTRSLGSVMLAHGATNLLLGIYVLATDRWYFW